MRALTRETFADIRALPRAVWVLTAGQFINRFGCFVYPFLTLHLLDRGLPGGQVALVLSSMAVGQMVSPFVSGYLSDAIGRRNTILISLIGGAISIVMIYYGQTAWQIAMLAALHGFLAQLFGPAANALLSDVVAEEKRVTAYAVFRLALNAGYAAGPAMAGLLYNRAPVLIFWGDAATSLVFAGLAFRWLPHGLRTITGRVTSPAVAWQSWLAVARDVGLNRAFMQLLLSKLLMSLAFIQVFYVLSVDATARGLTTVQYGMVMGFNGVVIMCVELPLVQWLKRFASRPVLVVGFVMVGIGSASFAWAESMTGFLLAMGLFTVGEMITLPMCAAYGAKLAPPEYRGRYFGFFGLMWGLAGLAGGTGVWFYGQLGPIWWCWIGCAGVLAGAVMALPVALRPDAPVLVEAATESAG
ncbi:MFS transporter [Synoicihabitans lomoniglobus]|uniref:MFS transporter n=1 Tax=Synoicihabitans lomoniglobus TaxID=2909285 RepID=A0AAF0CS78_9BACT|nr:MFS transporter [Opitutaceae bacterium LMO-M01]WED67130.1 MFS transporter [Opitutaceae bacterium LMO-M01]